MFAVVIHKGFCATHALCGSDVLFLVLFSQISWRKSRAIAVWICSKGSRHWSLRNATYNHHIPAVKVSSEMKSDREYNTVQNSISTSSLLSAREAPLPCTVQNTTFNSHSWLSGWKCSISSREPLCTQPVKPLEAEPIIWLCAPPLDSH